MRSEASSPEEGSEKGIASADNDGFEDCVEGWVAFVDGCCVSERKSWRSLLCRGEGLLKVRLRGGSSRRRARYVARACWDRVIVGCLYVAL